MPPLKKLVIVYTDFDFLNKYSKCLSVVSLQSFRLSVSKSNENYAYFMLLRYDHGTVK